MHALAHSGNTGGVLDAVSTAGTVKMIVHRKCGRQARFVSDPRFPTDMSRGHIECFFCDRLQMKMKALKGVNLSESDESLTSLLCGEGSNVLDTPIPVDELDAFVTAEMSALQMNPIDNTDDKQTTNQNEKDHAIGSAPNEYEIVNVKRPFYECMQAIKHMGVGIRMSVGKM